MRRNGFMTSRSWFDRPVLSDVRPSTRPALSVRSCFDRLSTNGAVEGLRANGVEALLTIVVLVLPPAIHGQERLVMPAASVVLGAVSTAASPAAVDQAQPPPASAQTSDEDEEEQAALDRTQPDFTLINLPTTRRLPRFKSAFRVTHRFGRPLGQGDFGDLVSNLFGLDSGARIGLEYRFGLLKKTQIGIYRTSDRTINLFGEYNVAQQNDRVPVGVLATVSVDGTNNFRDQHSPVLSAVISRALGEPCVVYLVPTYVGNTSFLPLGDQDTVLVGLGGRLRIRPGVYLVGEFHPRVGGYRPGANYGTFGVEKQVGGHVFQLNFSNAFQTTPSQIARGANGLNDWHLGFNISRKFF